MRRKADLASRLNRTRRASSEPAFEGSADAGGKEGIRKLFHKKAAFHAGASLDASDSPDKADAEDGRKEGGIFLRGLAFRLARVLLLLLCSYMVFLIYGVIVTEYGYGPDGGLMPRIMTVEDRRERRDFEAVLAAYEQCRMLYEKILLLDYRMGLGLEEPMTLAPEYEALLEAGYGMNVSSLVIRIEALPVNPRYNRLKELMLSWGRNDVALYLQHMSAAITKNDADAAGKTLQDKDAVYYDFSTMTQNIVTIGDAVPGMDMASVRSWSPSGFLEGQVG